MINTHTKMHDWLELQSRGKSRQAERIYTQ